MSELREAKISSFFRPASQLISISEDTELIASALVTSASALPCPDAEHSGEGHRKPSRCSGERRLWRSHRELTRRARCLARSTGCADWRRSLAQLTLRDWAQDLTQEQQCATLA